MNNLPNIWSVSPELTVKGPVLRSYRYNQEFGTFMHYFECEVANKGVLPAASFGAFAEIVNRGNINKAYLEAWVAPGFFDSPSAPVFTTQTSRVHDLNEFICKADVSEVVVAAGTAADEGNTIWESAVDSFDGTHAKKRTVTIVETKEVKEGEYDQNLGAHIPITRTLVHKTVAEMDPNFPSGLLGAANPYQYITFDKVRCDWYVKTSQEMRDDYGYSSNETRNAYWPAVLVTPPEIAGVDGQDEAGTTYTVKQAREVNIKESYNGECLATVAVGWEPAVPSAPTLKQHQPDAIYYEGILFNLTIPECLHPAVTLFEVVTDHPVYTTQTRSKTYPATNYTDWEVSRVVSQQARPYRGGYLVELVTVFSPT